MSGLVSVVSGAIMLLLAMLTYLIVDFIRWWEILDESEYF